MRFPIPTPALTTACLAVLAAALGTGPTAEEAAVQVYECNQGGRIAFSDTPCAGPQKTLEVDYSRPDAAQARQAAEAAQAQESVADTVGQAALLDTEILNEEKRIAALETERDARVAALRVELSQGTENPNVDAWQASMKAQMESVYNSYNDDLITERARLGQLHAQREALAGPPAGSGAPR